MDKKLVLELPDAQAAIAPLTKYQIAEGKERRRTTLLFPVVLLGALGAVLGKMQADQPEVEKQAPAEPENPAAAVEETSSDIEVIEEVAAFLHEMAAQSIFGGIEEDREKRLASVRVGFADTGGLAADSRTFRAGNANDNDLGVIDRSDSFEFPPIGSQGGGSHPPVQGPRTGLPGGDKTPASGVGLFEPPIGDGESPFPTVAEDDGDDAPLRVNRFPYVLGRTLLANGLMNLSVIIMLDDLLAMTRDPDGDTLAVKNLGVSSGTIRAYGDNAWIYTPERGYVGEVSFSYGVSDGHGTVATKAFLNLLKHPPRELMGTSDDDMLLGTPQEDIIVGLDGNDTIHGRESDDILVAGDGDDHVIGGDGNDVLYGDDGHDHLFGGKGNDVLFGGEGNDQLFGDEGDDILIAGAGDDVLHGGSGADQLFGDSGNDMLYGEAGNDLLDGGGGHDVLVGGGGDDAVVAGAGDDMLLAGLAGEEARGAGVQPSDGNDVYSGGEGFDLLDAAAATNAVTIDLSAGTAVGEDIGSDRLDGIEGAVGGASADVLTGNAEANNFDGAAGDDVLTGGDGDDVIAGGAGDDIVVATARDSGDCDGDHDDGDDVYSGGEGFDTLDLTALVQEVLADLEAEFADGAEIGSDRVHGFEAVLGGNDDDLLRGNAQANLLAGGDGDDRLSGRGGDDILIGGAGDDVAWGDAGNDTVIVAVVAAGEGGNDGADRYDGGEGCDTYDASDLLQAVVIDLDRGTATGCDIGIDQLESIEAAIGGSGADTIVASNAVNFLAGGGDADVFVFRSVEAIVNEERGRDEIRDFGVGDRIDLSELASGVGGLVFRSLLEQADEAHVKSVTFYHQKFDDGERTVVKAIIDLERDQDIEILLYGRHELTEQDFILAALESVADEPTGRG
ncbi:Ca2+-binding RTX toxin-like protein [Rhizobium sp. BK313]|uniref:cadherin-like domain-containing protein n=1 Tax=Rhizobium sp. BK313 TaxID=2587081 RepID=UPI00105FB21B|nr:cadherin-like domain-containing protein [Rhizobium sp. BK313]MBB3458977.1 Ca2+-binding RTX toxin-like protein [Rhizobium sp. BK313]